MSRLLLESGDDLLQELGDFILLDETADDLFALPLTVKDGGHTATVRDRGHTAHLQEMRI